MKWRRTGKRRTVDPEPPISAEQRTKEILSKVRQVEVRTNRLVDEALAGHYQSVFKGRGMDFDSVREYARGDEIRTIDWNVTARTGQTHVKMFTEEREMTMLLMIDVSESTNFGSSKESKRELAAEVGSVLAFSAIRNNDRVGLILYANEVELYIPPAKGRRHILRVIREILFFEPKGWGTDVRVALDFANKVMNRRAVIFLMSDFCFEGNHDSELAALEPKLRSTNRRHDLVAVTVNDIREAQLPKIGILAIEDSETGEVLELDTGKGSVIESFSKLANAQRNALQRLFRRNGVDVLKLTTGESYLAPLLGFFKSHERRLAS